MAQTAHLTRITPDAEDMSDPFSQAGDTHSWACTGCPAAGTGLADAFAAAAAHIRTA